MAYWMETHMGTAACLAMAVMMLLCALPFHLGGAKMARFVSGFNMFSPAEREQYDQAAICRDIRDLYLKLFKVMLIGAALSFLSQWTVPAAFGAWLVLFFKEVRLDYRKAFEKYRLDKKAGETGKK